MVLTSTEVIHNLLLIPPLNATRIIQLDRELERSERLKSYHWTYGGIRTDHTAVAITTENRTYHLSKTFCITSVWNLEDDMRPSNQIYTLYAENKNQSKSALVGCLLTDFFSAQLKHGLELIEELTRTF